MHVFSLQSSDDSSTLVYVTSFPYEVVYPTAAENSIVPKTR